MDQHPYEVGLQSEKDAANASSVRLWGMRSKYMSHIIPWTHGTQRVDLPILFRIYFLLFASWYLSKGIC